MAIRFDCSKEELDLIHQIVALSEDACRDYGIPFGNRLNAVMDVTACHMNGCPLDLQKLLNFPDPDLLHDMMGICKHLDRTTGQLQNHFLPRSAA